MADSIPKKDLSVEGTETDVSEISDVPEEEHLVCLDYSSFRMNSEQFLLDMERDALSSMRRGIQPQRENDGRFYNVPRCTTWDSEWLGLSENTVSRDLKPVPASLWEELRVEAEREFSSSDEKDEDEDDDEDVPDHVPSFSDNESDEDEDDVPSLTDGDEKDDEEGNKKDDVSPSSDENDENDKDDEENDNGSKYFKKTFDRLYQERSSLASNEEKEVTASLEDKLHQKRQQALVISYNALLRSPDFEPEVFNREVFEANVERMQLELRKEQERVRAKVEAKSMSLLYRGIYPTYEMLNIVQAVGRAVRSTPPADSALLSTENLLSTEGKKRKRRQEAQATWRKETTKLTVSDNSFDRPFFLTDVTS